MDCSHIDHIKLGPKPETLEDKKESAKVIDRIINAAKEKFTVNPVLRLKMSVNSVKSVADVNGDKTQEEIGFNAVYSNEEGSANKQWSKWTPAANLTMSISNPQAFGKVLPGQFVFVDITPCEKDSI